MKDLKIRTDSEAVAVEVFVTWVPSSDDEEEESIADRWVLLRVGIILTVTAARVRAGEK